MWQWTEEAAPWLLLYMCFGFIAFAFKRGVPYDDDCWSPNHEYFMVRKQTLLSSVWSGRDDKEGWVLIYDKYGNLLHRWDGDLSTQGGPWWFGKEVLILNQPEATLPLPSDAGKGNLRQLCY